VTASQTPGAATAGHPNHQTEDTMPIPATHTITCIDAQSAGKLVAALEENEWENVTADGDVVTFPCDNPGGVMAVADYALENGLAYDADAAQMIRDLG
jgi:hypothetical protein